MIYRVSTPGAMGIIMCLYGGFFSLDNVFNG